MDRHASSRYDDRISLLNSYRKAILRWFDGEYGPEGQEELRSYINRNTKAAQSAVRDAGCLNPIIISPPPAIGGLVQRVDPFETVLETYWGKSLIRSAADMAERAVGVYENLNANTGLITLPHREVIDVATAIERALRPTFRSKTPESEREVQDALETILNALGVKFTREQDTTPVGSRAFKPDFVLAELDLALEVKLTKPNHSESKVQEELTSDITAYHTKWRHILFVIYDLGMIADPDRMRRENMRLFGVSVIVVKH